MSRTNHALRVSKVLCWGVLLVGYAASVMAQQTAVSSSNPTIVPPLVSFSGVLTDAHNKPLSGVVGMTFALYKESQGGVPLWLETQNVYPDKAGHYTVSLGATKSTGLPADIFVAGEARWLGVQAEGQTEQPRVLLLSVPYALKAGDAETIGGMPASAFVLAAPPASGGSGAFTPTAAQQPLAVGTTPVTTAGGTINMVPKFDAAADITNSQIFDNGTNVGIGTTTPASKLDVKGTSTVRGLFTLPSNGTATATKGANSQAMKMTASVFNSGTGTAVGQNFQLQAEPVGNNTSTASGTLNLLYATGSNALAETGLKIASNGRITFAAGQTFPGTGSGTVTNVASGLGLTGGPISRSGTLAIDPTVVPQLNVANVFTGNQTVNGNLSSTGIVSGAAFNIGSNLFAFGSYGNQNVFLGFAGNPTNTGTFNTATGYQALTSVTTGVANTANGYQALFGDTTGLGNTAVGAQALNANTTGGSNAAFGNLALSANTTGYANTSSGVYSLESSNGSGNTAMGYYAFTLNTTGGNNTAMGQWSGLTVDASPITGSNDTFLGSNSGMSTGTLFNATAIGANAVVGASNALVLGCLNGLNNCPAPVNVGIGTTTPAYALDVHGTGNFTGPVTFASGQTFPGTGTVTSVGSGAGLAGGPITGGGTLRIATGGVTNAMLANPSINFATTGAVTVAPVSVPLGGTATISLGPVALLPSANTFTGTQTVNGNVIVTGTGATVSASGGATGLYGVGSNYGVYGSGSIGAEGIGTSYGVFGYSSSGWGMQGGGGAGGVFGTSSSGFGISGASTKSSGTAVYGLSSTSGTRSGSGSKVTWGSGVWGDGGSSGTYGGNDGLTGTADGGVGVLAWNNSTCCITLGAYAWDPAGGPFSAYNSSNKGCYIDGNGNLTCTGTVSSIVQINGGQRKVAVSSIASAKNWVEDFGSARLTNGSAVVAIEPEYAGTVNTELEYHVFLTPNGDCRGLYVSRRTPTSFEVHELGGGTASIEFSYRVVALRKSLENVRMADHTNDPDPLTRMGHSELARPLADQK